MAFTGSISHLIARISRCEGTTFLKDLGVYVWGMAIKHNEACRSLLKYSAAEIRPYQHISDTNGASIKFLNPLAGLQLWNVHIPATQQARATHSTV